MKRIILYITIHILTACSTDNVVSFDKNFKVGYIDTILNDGCTESYTYDSIPTENSNYIFSSDMMESATININNENIFLKKNTSYSEGNKYVEIWKGGMWTVETKLTEIKKTCEECSYNKGTITIRTNQIEKVFKVHGESGC